MTKKEFQEIYKIGSVLPISCIQLPDIDTYFEDSTVAYPGPMHEDITSNAIIIESFSTHMFEIDTGWYIPYSAILDNLKDVEEC